MKIKRRHPITLLEIMIVIFIIGIIGSVLAYNMRGSIDEGKAYKSEHGSKQVHDFLSLAIAQGIKDALRKPTDALSTFGFIHNPDKLLKDGWGRRFQIKMISDSDFIVYSENWEKYLINKKKFNHDRLEEEYPWAFNYKNEPPENGELPEHEETLHPN